MSNRQQGTLVMAQKDRLSVDLKDIKQQIEECRTDAAWRELPLTGKVRTLIIERLESLDESDRSTESGDGDVETLKLLIAFLNCLLDTFDYNGFSLTEIAEILGRDDSRDLVALFKKLQNGNGSKKTEKV